MDKLIGWGLNVCYLAALVVLAPAIAWSSLRTGKYREGWGSKLFGMVPQRKGRGGCYWLHAVSVGEVNLLATTIAELKQRRPDAEIVVSTTTKTGYDLALRKYGATHVVCYCPLDFTWAARRAMRRIRPELLILAELELWPNLIAAAKKHGARVAIVNGRLSENSFRGYRRLRPLVARTLRMVDLIAAQDETTAERFRQLGASAPSVVTTGSLKYDGAETSRDNAKTRELRELAEIGDNEIVWLVGSTQAPEEQIAINIFGRLAREFPQLRLIIVPRHPQRFDEVAKLLEASKLSYQRRSRFNHSTLHPPFSTLLIDTIGELGAWWGMADIGFVGGSFGDRGGQNMIEPAAYGVATCFGPNTRNFRDIVAALLSVDGARVVADEAALEAFVRQCLTNESFRQELGERSRAFVETQLGATARTVSLLLGTNESCREAA